MDGESLLCVRCAVCCVLCAVCCVLCAVCCVLCAVYCVLCTNTTPSSSPCPDDSATTTVLVADVATEAGWEAVGRHVKAPMDMYVLDSSYYEYTLYTLYTPFIAVQTPMYTRYTCIYVIYTPYIDLTHLYTP